MIADKYIELIHREIDGINSPQEAAKLKAYLAENSEAQQLYSELTAMSALMREVKPVEPPAHLPHVIMNMLPSHRYSAKVRQSVSASTRAWFETGRNVKFAFAFAGGLVAGAILFAIFSQTALRSPVDLDRLSGTMMLREAAENFVTIGSLEISGEDITGKIEVKQASDLVRTELTLEATHPVELTITFDERYFALKSLTFHDETATGEAILIPGAAQLTHTGHKSYTLLLTKNGETQSALEFKLVRADEVLYERAMAVE